MVDGGIVDIGSGTYPVSNTINLRGKAFTMQGRRDKAGGGRDKESRPMEWRVQIARFARAGSWYER